MTNDQLIQVLVQVESEGNPGVIGDQGRAFGVLQIRQLCLDDFNAWNGTKYELKDVLGKKGIDLSYRIFNDYMAHYATEKRLGRPVTPTDKARIWNGGPSGWRKVAATAPYVKRMALKAGGLGIALA